MKKILCYLFCFILISVHFMTGYAVENNSVALYNDGTESFSIKEVTLKDSNNVVVNKCVPNGKLEYVTVIKNTSNASSAKLIAALYKGNKLEKMKMIDINESDNNETTYTVNLCFDSITEAHMVKIMIWDSLNNLKPKVAPYNTNIVAPGYIYNNTIQATGQIDKYNFTVPEDGYYSIAVLSGNSINGSLYHSSNLEDELVFRDNMSSTNTMVYYLIKDEVYTVNFTSTQQSAYSFTITNDYLDNEILLTTQKQGTLAYSKDKLCYKFEPDESAIYVFEMIGDVYPVAEVLNDSLNCLTFADNLIYTKTNTFSLELQANQTYYLRVGSQSGQTGNVTIYVKKVTVNISENSVTITGKADIQAGLKCGLAIYDTYGDLIRVAQETTKSDGSFSYTTELSPSSSVYQCIINQEHQTSPIYLTFGNGNIIKNINLYNQVPSKSGATVTPVFSASKLAANENMKTDITITNNDSVSKQDILVFWALMDTHDNIINACGTGSEFKSRQTQTLHMEMTMPSSVSELSLKLFIWQGKSIDESSFIPLATVYTISSLSTSASDNTSGNETENMLTNDIIVQDISNDDKKATNPDNVSPKFGIYDYIDINYQVRSNGENTGGLLHTGKNIISIYYKNKTNKTQTFDPLALWGYYDSNNEFHQTYFQWHESITLEPKGNSNGDDVKIIEYEVEVPENSNLTAAYWAIDDEYSNVCLSPTSIAVNGLYKGQATPLFFEEAGNGKFILCNNREGIKRTDLADSNNPNPKLLMHEKGLPDGKYEMLLFHNNDTSLGINSDTGETIHYGSGFPIYLDVQFYDPYETAQLSINSIGYQIPTGGESWACIQGYSDYKQISITDLELSNAIYPNENLNLPYSNNFKQKPSMWISEKLPENYYTSVPVSNCVYMVIEFEIFNSQGIEINVAAFEDKGNFSDRFSDYQAGNKPDVAAPFIKDMQYKGIADTLPLVKTKAIMAFDDDTPYNSNLPMTVFNALSPGGNAVDWWKTNINPQAEGYYANHSDDSNMLHFTYNDPQKLNAYGVSFSGKKDTVWRFDTEHSDTYKFPAEREADNDPNYVLPRPTIINSQGESSNRDVAQNLANYGVVIRYDYSIFNNSTSQKNININLEASANNVIIIRNPDNPDGLFYAMYKGESNPMAKDVIFEAVTEGAGDGIGVLIDIILTTGNAGGMANSITIK